MRLQPIVSRKARGRKAQRCSLCNISCTRIRRDPYGSVYCCTCGGRIMYRVYQTLKNNKELKKYTLLFSEFLTYVKPSLIGLQCDTNVRYKPFQRLPKHKRRSKKMPVFCHSCGTVVVPGKQSRRGYHPNVFYCNPCGSRWRRMCKKGLRADMKLKRLIQVYPNMCKYIRDDILEWVKD